MNSSRLFNVSGIPLLMKCGGGCHLLQKLIMLEIHFPISFVALTGDLGPQSEAHTLTRKLTLGRFLFGGGGWSSGRTREFPGPRNQVWSEDQSCFRAVAHTEGHLCAVTGIISRYYPPSWSFSPIKVLWIPSYSLRKLLFCFKFGSCFLLKQKLDDTCLMSHSLDYKFMRALLEFNFVVVVVVYRVVTLPGILCGSMLTEWFLWI